MKRNQGSEGEMADGPVQKKAKMSPTPSSSLNAIVPKENKDDNANIMTSASATVVTAPSTGTVATSGEGNATTTETGTWTKVEKRKKKKMAKAEAKNDVCVYLSLSSLFLATLLSFPNESLPKGFGLLSFVFFGDDGSTVQRPRMPYSSVSASTLSLCLQASSASIYVLEP
jgi:hypothetical protein